MSRLVHCHVTALQPRGSTLRRTAATVAAATALLAIAAPTAQAQQTAATAARSEQPAPTLPAAPDKDRVPVHITAGGSLRFAIGANSLRVGPGQVVRYVLFAQSPGGPENISFEAIDCATGNWQMYALWNSGTQNWTATQDPSWQRIRANGATRVHATLQGDFCSVGMVHGDAAAIVRRVAEGLHAQSDVRSNPYSF